MHLDKIQKMRARLVKHRTKIADMETQAAEMEKEIKKAEEEQLGYLARSAANTLSGGMDEVFELLRGLRIKPDVSGLSGSGNDASDYNVDVLNGINEDDNPNETRGNPIAQGNPIIQQGSEKETEVVGLELADETN